MSATRSEVTAAVGAVEVVDRQLAAYNANDIEAFLATYSPEAELFRPLTGPHPVMIGHDQIRAGYGPRFAAAPGAHADIVQRIVCGDLVTDHEDLPLTAARAVVTYQVRGGLIRRSWVFGPVPAGDIG